MRSGAIPLAFLIPLALKVLYTAILLFLGTLCLREVWRVWFSRSLVLRPFSYVRDGQQVPEAGTQFIQLVRQDLDRILDLLSSAAGSEDEILTLPTVDQRGREIAPVQLPSIHASVFDDIDLQAYGIQLSGLIRRLSNEIAPPVELVGSVSERAGKIDCFVELRGDARRRGNTSRQIRRVDGLDAASYSVACRVFHLVASPRSPVLASGSDEEFELFARALDRYQDYRSGLKLSGASAAGSALNEAAQILEKLDKKTLRGVYLYKLMALVSLARGHREQAIAELTMYLERWPANVAKDGSAEQLLARLAAEQRVNAEQLGSPQTDNSRAQRRRPICPGISISVEKGTTASSICCFVRDREGKVFLLSTDFALAGDPGTDVLQPAALDGGTPPGDVVARVSRIVVGRPNQAWEVAAAIAEVTGEFDPASPELGPFTGTAQPQLGDRVRVSGRTSSRASGTISGLDFITNIGFPSGVRQFKGLASVRSVGDEPFSRAGDSGAPVVNENGQLVGIVYGGTQTMTFVMPIEPVLRALDVELITKQ